VLIIMHSRYLVGNGRLKWNLDAILVRRYNYNIRYYVFTFALLCGGFCAWKRLYVIWVNTISYDTYINGITIKSYQLFTQVLMLIRDINGINVVDFVHVNDYVFWVNTLSYDTYINSLICVRAMSYDTYISVDMRCINWLYVHEIYNDWHDIIKCSSGDFVKISIWCIVSSSLRWGVLKECSTMI